MKALKVYIQMNMDGLKDSIIEMLAGSNVPVNTETFSNDMTTFASKDDVLTLLVHLGYLTYHSTTESVAIPNREVSKEYVNAISTMDWPEVIRSIQASRELLNALWRQNSDAVAAGIDQAHQEISILQYNDENSLSCTISSHFILPGNITPLCGSFLLEKVLRICAFFHVNHISTNPLLS